MSQYRDYYEFLANRVPHYDEAILKDWMCEIHPIGQDLRLLPVRLRKMVRLHKFCACSLRWTAKHLRVPYSTLRAMIKRGEEMLEERTKDWLESLPKRRRKKEESKRGDGWIGQVTTGKWDFKSKRSHIFDRLNAQYPNLSQKWKTTP